ncbi:hypothetical protein BLOT_016224 [Blomia tropicalis]|nr:hypothetical protein BLOT_016224 [Blomia tropicalis]
MNERTNKQTNKQTSGTILYVIDDDDAAAAAIITTKDSHRYPHLPADCIPKRKKISILNLCECVLSHSTDNVAYWLAEPNYVHKDYTCKRKWTNSIASSTLHQEK